MHIFFTILTNQIRFTGSSVLTCFCFCEERDWTLTLLKRVPHGHGPSCEPLPGCSNPAAANCLQKCSHPAPVWCTVNKFALVLAGELLGITEKNHCFLWLSFFLLDLPLKMCTVRCCSGAACCPPWGDSWLQLFWGSYSFFFFCLRLSFLNLLPFKLYCYYTNGFVSSYGEGLCQKINATTYVEITYYNYYTQIISLDSLIAGNRNQLGLP